MTATEMPSTVEVVAPVIPAAAVAIAPAVEGRTRRASITSTGSRGSGSMRRGSSGSLKGMERKNSAGSSDSKNGKGARRKSLVGRRRNNNAPTIQVPSALGAAPVTAAFSPCASVAYQQALEEGTTRSLPTPTANPAFLLTPHATATATSRFASKTRQITAAALAAATAQQPVFSPVANIHGLVWAEELPTPMNGFTSEQEMEDSLNALTNINNFIDQQAQQRGGMGQCYQPVYGIYFVLF